MRKDSGVFRKMGREENYPCYPTRIPDEKDQIRLRANTYGYSITDFLLEGGTTGKGATGPEHQPPPVAPPVGFGQQPKPTGAALQ